MDRFEEPELLSFSGELSVLPSGTRLAIVSVPHEGFDVCRIGDDISKSSLQKYFNEEVSSSYKVSTIVTVE